MQLHSNSLFCVLDAELHAMQQEITGIISMLEEIQPAPDTELETTTTVVASAADTIHEEAKNPTAAEVDPLTAALQPDDPITSLANYNRFARLLPYKTDDPETQQRQETLLNLLYTNNICNEHTFRIFIMAPEQHEADATHILDQMFQLDVVSTSQMNDIQLQQHGDNDDDNDDPVPMDHCALSDADMQMEPLRLPADDEAVGSAATATATALLMSPASQISTLTGAMDLGSPNIAVVQPEIDASNAKLYPIFNRATADSGDSFSATASNVLGRKTMLQSDGTRLIAWRAYGRDAQQLQIDAGQKRFGGGQCRECGMFYARHEPEDEALHQRFHDVSDRLQFKGWQEERIVCRVDEWGRGGRILCVTAADTKAKLARVAAILTVVDDALGVVDAEDRMAEQNVVSVPLDRA